MFSKIEYVCFTNDLLLRKKAVFTLSQKGATKSNKGENRSRPSTATLKIKIAIEQKNSYTRSLLQIQKTSGIAASGHVREYGMFSKIECEWSSRGSGFVGKCAKWRNVSKICVWIKGVRAKKNTESKPMREEQREKNKERCTKRGEQREMN
jgi:hypothetical protein